MAKLREARQKAIAKTRVKAKAAAKARAKASTEKKVVVVQKKRKSKDGEEWVAEEEDEEEEEVEEKQEDEGGDGVAEGDDSGANKYCWKIGGQQRYRDDKNKTRRPFCSFLFSRKWSTGRELY